MSKTNPTFLLLSFISSLFFFFFCSFTIAFSPTVSILLDCGASSPNTTVDGRTWISDTSLAISSLISSSKRTVPIPASNSNSNSSSSAISPILLSARVFPSTSTYTFSELQPGDRYWLRLYFFPFAANPSSPSPYDLQSSLFWVSSNGFTLLSYNGNNNGGSEHNGGSEQDPPNPTPYLFKEYSINVSRNGQLTISFEPSPGSFAFVNAIELVSMPADIIPLELSASYLGIIDMETSSSTLECVHRVNVGGPSISPSNDSMGLYRTWLANETFLFNASSEIETVTTTRDSIIYPPPLEPYIAPEAVYSTGIQLDTSMSNNQSQNISWLLPVHHGFLYMVRLHFCEIRKTTAGSRVFDVYLQNETAFHKVDLVALKGADNAYYRDFLVDTSSSSSSSSSTSPVSHFDSVSHTDKVSRLNSASYTNKLAHYGMVSHSNTDTSIWIQIGPISGKNNNNAILNGIEVWKLNNTVGSLDGPISIPPGISKDKMEPKILLGAIVSASILMLGFFIFLFLFCVRKKSKIYKQSPHSKWVALPRHRGLSVSSPTTTRLDSTTSHKSSSSGASRSYVSSVHASTPGSSLGRLFTFLEIQEATNNFDETLVLGVGGFGKVYKGNVAMDTGMKVVAVKRGNPRSEQGVSEFQTEIDMLSKLRHRHLVSLIGYCDERCEMILVYEYMANGPLRNHLYGTDLPSLSWKQRLEICIGAARGLHYLHTGASQGIIHRDVKTTNILLDENLVAKVSDFGLSKTGPSLDRTHVSTAVKGSFGYLDPEYFRRQQLTEKSDVYSFGVVLFEVLCARPAINPALPREQVNIAEWAMHWHKMGLLREIIDPLLGDTVNAKSLKKFGETAQKCLSEQGVDRPTIGDVLWNLEYALQLQETAVASENEMGTTSEEESQSRILELPIWLPHREHAGDTSIGVPLQERAQFSSISMASSEGVSEDATDSRFFSQLVKPKGR